jgi:hypothetical protein
MNLVSRVKPIMLWTENSHILAEVKNDDAVFVLAYSIIMLNTDQHNPQIRVNIPGPCLAIPSAYP